MTLAHASTDPDLENYDLVELSSSAGKDSLAMLVLVRRLLLARGLMDRAVVIHADLGRVEWPGTRELVEAQAKHLGFPRVVVVKRTQGDLLEHVERYGKWPTPSTRYCTADHKRAQIWKAFTELAAEVRASWPEGTPARPVRILNCVGLRAEESPGRRKRPTLSRDTRASNGRREVDVWLPIQHLTEAEVWEEVRASGAPVHPAYAAGLPRASCVFCIYAPEAALVRAGRANPELLEEYVRVERAIGHDFKHRLPIVRIAERIAQGDVPEEPVKSWCM